jgi:hypothetical protein
MTVDGQKSRPKRGLAITALVAMTSGFVIAIGEFASLSLLIVGAGATTLIGSIVVFGLITYRDARSSESTFGSALARSLRTAGKVLVALMP